MGEGEGAGMMFWEWVGNCHYSLDVEAKGLWVKLEDCGDLAQLNATMMLYEKENILF